VHRTAPLCVGPADHGHVLDLGTRTKEVLDGGGIDVLTTGIDHVGLAVDEVVEAVLVATGHVSHREIALAEGFPVFSGNFQ